MVEGWKYYNHALIPNKAPHELIDEVALDNGDFWESSSGYVYLARWTSEFDCKKETKWWYVIKDDDFNIESLKAKRRYEINKGKKNYKVCIINPRLYSTQLYNVQVAAYSAWPQKYRPVVKEKEFSDNLSNWDKYIVYGAFDRERGTLCGYALLEENNEYASFLVLRTMPECEKKGINAAIVVKIVEDYNERIARGGVLLV